MLAYKYKLWPGVERLEVDSVALEQTAARVALIADAAGVIMLVLYRNKRVEIVAGLREEALDLPELLQKLADQVKDGDGMPIGEHGRIINQS